MCQGVTKSGSPPPSEMTSFIPCTMSKKSRMPERGMAPTWRAMNRCGFESTAFGGAGRGWPANRPAGSGGGLISLAPYERLGLAQHGGAGDGHACDVVAGGRVVNDIQHEFLQQTTQGARASPFFDRLRRKFAQGVGREFQFHPFHVKQLLVLLDQRVARLSQDRNQLLLRQFFQHSRHW